MKSFLNVLAGCEVYVNILVVKLLIQKIRLLLLLTFKLMCRGMFIKYTLFRESCVLQYVMRIELEMS
jgi:hypothetical protein